MLLTYAHWGLVPCDLEETEDECIFTFQTGGLTEGISAKDLETADKFRLLANCADLELLADEYQFSMKPENIVYDRNLCISILLRDQKDELKEADFFRQYQALAAAILCPGYTYDEYLQGGNTLYKKKRKLKKIQKCESVQELQEYLLTAWEDQKQYIKREKKLVKRSSVWMARITIPLLMAACLAGAYMWVNLEFVRLPYQERLLAAHQAYLSFAYAEVEDHLNKLSIEKLPLESQYILARSYIYTEGLTPEQRDNLLAGLSLKADKAVFQFWIALGRGDYVQAVDTAKRLGNDEFLLYTYIKQSAYTRTNTDLNGEEKSELISKLEGDIRKMSESMAAEKVNMEETTRAVLELEETMEIADTAESDEQGETDESIDTLQ